MAVCIDRAVRHALVVASIALAGYTGPALAMEFGSMTVHSRLNQPLDATVVLGHLDASERASLDVGIAPSSMFQRFGIRRSSAVDRIRIDTRMRDDGRQAVVHITTQRPIGEPFVDFLLQVESGNGRALREYTAMLDPVGEGASTTAGVLVPSGPHVSNTPHSHTAAQAGPSTYRVRPGDTLWSIAAAHTPADSTVAQAMLAIYRANPSAFGDSMRALSLHARLAMPSAADIRSIDAGVARDRLENTKARETASDTPAPDQQTKLAASGEAPPTSLGDKQSEVGATADDDQTPESAGAFGRLSLPSDAPWPETDATGRASGRAEVAGNTRSAAASPAVTAETGAAASNASPNSGASTTASGASVDTPRDVAETDSAGWLSPRNLLLFAVLLVLIVLAVRRLRERGYRPVALEPAQAEGADPSKAAAAPADTPVAGSDEAPDKTAAAAWATSDTPAPEYPSPPEQPRNPVDAPGSTTASRKKADQNHGMVPRPPETAPDTPLAETQAAGGAVDHESDPIPAPGGYKSAPRDEPPLRFQPAAPGEPGRGLFAAPRRPVTSQEIEALTFETQPLPEAGQREHDLGAADEPGLEFEAGAPDGRASGAESASGAGTSGDRRANDPHALEMIDPGEFDLYDPPSRNTGPNEDDPKQSVAIRLDLARMYIDMGDSKAAHELLADVRERGDEAQRRAADQLLEQVDA